MSSLCKVFLLGNVGQEPSVRSLNEGIVASVSLATPERFKDRSGEWQENTQWHSVQVFGKTAEFVQNYVHKGDQLFVEGKIRYRKYTNRDGVEVSVTEIIADNVQRIGGSRQDNAPAPQQRQQRPAPRRQDPVDDLPADYDPDLGF